MYLQLSLSNVNVGFLSPSFLFSENMNDNASDNLKKKKIDKKLLGGVMLHIYIYIYIEGWVQVILSVTLGKVTPLNNFFIKLIFNKFHFWITHSLCSKHAFQFTC